MAATRITTQDIKDSAITDAKVAAGIDAVKLADGSVSNAELQHLNGVMSAIQTQLDGKGIQHSHPAVSTIWGLPGVGIYATAAGQTVFASSIYYMPFAVSKSITVTGLKCKVANSPTALSVSRWAIYAADTAMQPGALVADLGELTVDSAGIKTLSGLSVVLAPGNYLLMMHTGANLGTLPTFDVFRGNPAAGSLIDGVTNWLWFNRFSDLTVTYAPAADPGVPWDSTSTSTNGFYYWGLLNWTPT